MRGHSIAALPLLVLFASAEENELPELVVEASGQSVVPPHFAGSATVIDAKTIAGSGARSVADLLATQAGIRISSTSGNLSGGQVHLRGFGANAASRVLVLVDGRPINRPDMGGVSWLEVPLSRIERVEILRGGQTARFGDNGVGGVINLVTKTGGPQTALEAAGGSDGYWLGRLSHRAGDFSFDLERNFTDGWRENAANELESMALRWQRDFSGGGTRFGLAWSDEFSGFPGPLTSDLYKDDPRQSIYARAGQADQYFNRQETWRADASASLGSERGFRLEIPLAWSARDQEWNFGPGSHADNRLETLTATPELRWTSEKSSAALGANFRRDTLAIAQFAEIERRNRTGTADLTREVAGIFANADHEAWDGWYFSGAARIEQARVEARARSFLFPADPALNFSRRSSETNAALELGLRWEPYDDFTGWFRYDRIYRLPSTDEIAAYQGYPMAEPFNDRLEAETGHNFELGMEWRPGPWNLRLGGFAQWLEGEIAYDFTRNLNVNLADTRRLGLEGGIGYRSGMWEANLHATWLSAVFRDGPYKGNDVFLVPRLQAGGTLACHLRDDFTAQIEYQFSASSYEGDDFANVREKLPSYGVANLLLRYEPKPGLSLYVRVNNLFDERYATVKYHGVWYPAAGRQFQIGVRREL